MGSSLRQRAEVALCETRPLTTQQGSLTAEQAREMLHELQVHQIELEMQNDELRRTQSALEVSHSRYANLYELAPVGYCSINEHGVILQTNLTATTMLGMQRQALIGQSFFRFIATQDQDNYYRHLKQQLGAGQRKTRELRMVCADGVPFWVNLTSEIADWGEAGATLNIVLSDISERKLAELAQQRSEQFFETIAGNLPAMVAYWTSDLQCAYANNGYQEWYGRAPEQMRGIRMQDLLGVELFQRNEPHVRAVLRGQDQQFERQLVKPNGELSCVLAHYIADRSGDEVSGFFVLVTDISSVKRSEESLRIAAVAFESQEGIVVMDVGQKILKVNHAFTVLSGYSEQELVGKQLNDFRSALNPSAFYEHIAAEVARCGFWQGDVLTQKKNGDPLVTLVNQSAVYDELGQISHYVISLTDVTSNRLQEKERLFDESAHRSILVREVHHRIKNNLQGITGLLRRLSQKQPAIADDIDRAISQVHSISVVHGLQGLDISATVHLGDLIAAIAREIGELWQATVTLSIGPEWQQCIIVESEAVPVALVLNELVLNAVKHADPKSGPVQITLQAGAQPKSVQVRILNAGQLTPDMGRNGARHSGLQLVAALLPRDGALLTHEQLAQQILTTLELAPPVIASFQKVAP